ncbi:hypothetical protein GA0074692_5267 [Micromonospora pallida]|uniref:DUF5666 domain-containing protein n=1 Tax=Micromonospora pallida TaxID=145854 RepID=A0A1C6TCE0_9ACTN|nr:hypothetical protein [Micromonospora pallida]SCL39173.1 hypothetical protein GA0074692_5267 [Micromonospora pallida]
MPRWGITTATLLTAAALGLTGCGPTDARTADGGTAGGTVTDTIDVIAGLGPEGQALAALGLDTDDLDVDVEPMAAPAPSPSAAPEGSTAPERAGDRPRRERAEQWRKKRPARVLLRKGTLHGEAVVRTKDGGTKTVLVQRGEVTAIDGDSMTVKSTDGFTMTWRFGDDLRVVERRSTVQPEQVKVGSKVGVAGTKDGDAGVARLVVVPRAK